MKRWGDIPCEVFLSPYEIRIKITRPTFIFSRQEYVSPWNMLQGVSTNYVPQKEQRFYKVEFRDPPVTIYLNPTEKVLPGEETKFGALLMDYVAGINTRSEIQQSPKIDTRNFYQSRWAKVFTNVMLLIMVAIFVLYLVMPGTVDGWRIFQLTAFGSVWFSAYYFNRKKS